MSACLQIHPLVSKYILSLYFALPLSLSLSLSLPPSLSFSLPLSLSLSLYPPSLPPSLSLGDHMRANDEQWWIRKERERRLQIEESKKLSKLPKSERLGKERERLESWSQSPVRGKLGGVSTTKNADNTREVPKWKTINWARVLSRKRDDAVRPFSESDFAGGHYIGPDSYYNRFQRFQRLATANSAGRCTSCR